MPFTSPCGPPRRPLPPRTQPGRLRAPSPILPLAGSAAPSPGRHRSCRSLQPARPSVPVTAAAAILEADTPPTAPRLAAPGLGAATSALPESSEPRHLAIGARRGVGSGGEAGSEHRAVGECRSSGRRDQLSRKVPSLSSLVPRHSHFLFPALSLRGNIAMATSLGTTAGFCWGTWV